MRPCKSCEVTHIWLCRSKEHSPNLNDFLLYLKHIYQIENNASTVKNKWEPLLPYISLLTRVSKTRSSCQNLIKYKFLLYISFFVLFCLVSAVFFCPGETKKEKRRIFVVFYLSFVKKKKQKRKVEL